MERGELPASALDRPPPALSPAGRSDQQSLLGRLWSELFAESRYWHERNAAIAAREADLRRLKLERGETVGE